ncbi:MULTISPECIES: 2Fe-2S iron-sulfur cluster-binding protein [unclassified Prochlorococcus]|uniref:2Fe-2S iron-sulfur cluster-binding protein n=1 Tax=unclassified Prochlorococcus TaxID=2627481 RepID=UPI0005339812|nr:MULTISPECIES: 2Fe-2S iron-sulfur cluster-binding protein [unclassified Prochlorococcus]KGG15577.1 Ferredoxin [Prochlorococcus sp. MIT 0602]KGG17857.1 Ferredoxin [Prochlorococcus sp. MIT 0603]
MKSEALEIVWPNGARSKVIPGSDWLLEAKKAGVTIPTGCLTGSCGACEIEVNGKIIRACINSIEKSDFNKLKVDFYYDPFW